MQEKLHIACFAFLGLMVLYGCRTSLPEHRQGDTSLQYYKGACTGNCESYKLTIYPKRKAIYEGLANARISGRQQRKLEKATLMEVWTQIEAIDWDALPAAFPNKQPGAQAIYLILVQDGKRKEVMYKGMTPPQLTALVKRMEQIQAAGQWKTIKES